MARPGDDFLLMTDALMQVPPALAERVELVLARLEDAFCRMMAEAAAPQFGGKASDTAILAYETAYVVWRSTLLELRATALGSAPRARDRASASPASAAPLRALVVHSDITVAESIAILLKVNNVPALDVSEPFPSIPFIQTFEPSVAVIAVPHRLSESLLLTLGARAAAPQARTVALVPLAAETDVVDLAACGFDAVCPWPSRIQELVRACSVRCRVSCHPGPTF
jgi:hypothetical protein